jgi:hypothetical protein
MEPHPYLKPQEEEPQEEELQEEDPQEEELQEEEPQEEEPQEEEPQEEEPQEEEPQEEEPHPDHLNHVVRVLMNLILNLDSLINRRNGVSLLRIKEVNYLLPQMQS